MVRLLGANRREADREAPEDKAVPEDLEECQDREVQVGREYAMLQ